MVRKQVTLGVMPPWFAASPTHGPSPWLNDRSLPAADKADLLAWMERGRPEGKASHAPKPQTYPSEWQLGEPDAIIRLPEPVDVAASGVMSYINIEVPTGFDSDRWVQGWEIRPTARDVVHHVLVYVLPPGNDGKPQRNRPIDGTSSYLAAYAPWFASETAVNRHEVGQAIGPRQWYQPPDAIRSLWHYTYKAYHFHSTLTNSEGNHHPWESKPWTWPMSLRPVLYAIDDSGVPGCGAASCVKSVMLVGTPALWWLAVPALLYSCWRAFVRRDWRYAVVLVGYCAGWLPWFAAIDRQMYFFYAVTMAPFLVMLIALILGDILFAPSRNPQRPNAERRTLGVMVVCCYLALVITNFAWLFPILTGIPISQSTWNMQIWLPSWR
jgi:hypothetical protein